jgi:hypothetical protein
MGRSFALGRNELRTNRLAVKPGGPNPKESSASPLTLVFDRRSLVEDPAHVRLKDPLH